MRVEFKGIIAEEISFKMNKNGVSVNTTLDIKPQFSRQLRIPNNNPNINYLTLDCAIKDSAESPKPFDIYVKLVGIYEVEFEDKTQQDKFVIEETKRLYNHIADTIRQLTTSAHIAPMNLPPYNGPIFPNDVA